MNLSNSDPDRDAVDDLPPSAKYVLDVVDRADGSVRRDELLERTGMAPRTLDRALARLETTGAVRRDRDGDDLRYVRVTLSNPSDGGRT